MNNLLTPTPFKGGKTNTTHVLFAKATGLRHEQDFKTFNMRSFEMSIETFGWGGSRGHWVPIDSGHSLDVAME